jgi:uroporphyrinogen decarboxylase
MEEVMVQMITDPEALKKGLTALEGTVTAFINECMNSGAFFVWYLATRASKEIVTEEQYKEFGAPFDESVFKGTSSALHIAHICGVEPLFDLVDDWHSRYSNVKGVSSGSPGFRRI